MRSRIRSFALALAGVVFAAPMLVQAKVNDKINAPQTDLEKEVRHELVMLPYYNIFDNLEFKVEGDHVTLMGQVTRPTLKSDAGNVVKRIEGVHGPRKLDIFVVSA